MADTHSMTGHRSSAAGEDNHHGNTIAAWVTVTIITIAFVVGTLAVILADWTMFAVSVAILVAGPIVGKILQALGYGQPSMAKRRR